MAVEWRHLIFGDVDSANYGIYISGDGVYNAPERDVEFVSVPGRNGDIAMDQGRYNNITVTYPAGTFAKTQEEFREKLSDFRNAVLSQKGYQRLEDTYHPEEFRMAVYTSGLEVDPVNYNQAGEFELTFNCKPQRWLSVGALPIPVDSGDVLQNPTVFDSSPLLEVEGYGNISFNGFNITLDNSPLGVVSLIPRHSDGSAANFSKTYHFDRSLLDTGDTITVGGAVFFFDFHYAPNDRVYSSVTYSVNPASDATPSVTIGDGGSAFFVTMVTPALAFTALDEGDTEVQKLIALVVTATPTGKAAETLYVAVRIKCGYDYVTYDLVTSASGTVQTVKTENRFQSTPVTGNSTLPVLGNPTYIDCEIGEAYRIEDGEYKSSNSRVSIGADLPTLAPDSNKIIFDDTITDLKIAPRWWKV
jgi:phage-related protein